VAVSFFAFVFAAACDALGCTAIGCYEHDLFIALLM
jgi:hypothetical protein